MKQSTDAASRLGLQRAAERAGLVQVRCGAAAGTGDGVIGLREQRAASQDTDRALAPLPRGPSHRSASRSICPREDLICHCHSGQQCTHLCPGESTVVATGRTLLSAPECPTASSVCTRASAQEPGRSLGAARTGMWTGRGVPRWGRVREPLCLSEAPSRVGLVGWPWTRAREDTRVPTIRSPITHTWARGRVSRRH